MSWFDEEKHLCKIPIEPSSVRFLNTPDEFYNELLSRIGASQKRVILAALYLGTSEKERQIVVKLQDVLNEQPDLRVSLLFDYFRGTRGGNRNSTVALLQPLASKNGTKVCLFHTPELRGWLKRLLPERVNEVVGLQHMKFFVFDNTVLISGANLSEQYFVNRQDRYMLIENSPLLADFFAAIFDIVSAHSLHLNADGEVKFNIDSDSSLIHPLTGSTTEIQSVVNEKIDNLYAEFSQRISFSSTESFFADTFVCPFLQMGPFQIDHEVQLLSKLFGTTEEGLEVTLMTAYFNLYEQYADLILQKSRFPISMVFASERANGFFGASGLSGYIPLLYLHNSLEFIRRSQDRHPTIAFREWDRPEWTFHAKGLWVERGNRIATIVGSSNFGHRSAHRDLEAQVLLVTRNEALNKRIRDERTHLLEYAPILDLAAFLRRDALVPQWVKVFARFFRHFF